MKFMIGKFEVRLENGAVEVGSLAQSIGLWVRLEYPTDTISSVATLRVKTGSFDVKFDFLVK